MVLSNRIILSTRFVDVKKSTRIFTREMGKGRRGGSRAMLLNARPATRKQKIKYNRRKGEIEYEKKGKHSPPFSKANVRKEDEKRFEEEMLQLSEGKGEKENDDYTGMDAVLEDLIGNTSDTSSMETPVPERVGYLYEKQVSLISSLRDKNLSPSDKDVALLIRSYRDNNTFNKRRLGIANPLSHVVDTLNIPIDCLGRLSYHALLSCAARPEECLKLIDDMRKNSIKRDVYTFSILVDVYATRGDYRNCLDVIERMMPEENVEAGLAAYTSLLKACHKIITKGAFPTPLKHEAGKVAWESWKNMRINNIEADVMAYGAIIQIFAAKGEAEKCLSLLHEMQSPVFNVKPTTFVYTAALRGVARAHLNAIRFEQGLRLENKRRELIIRHLGLITRQILIMAENSYVKLDNGFIAALMSCSAVAGDFATTKAVHLASFVRQKCQFLRRIGDDDHLAKLRALRFIPDQSMSVNQLTNSENLPDGSTNTFLASQRACEDALAIEKETKAYHEQQTLREHGHDTRHLTTLLHSYANSMKSPGLGQIWSSHTINDIPNKGYLHEQSLNEIVKYQEPQLVSNLPDGVTDEDIAFATKISSDENNDLKQKKFKLKKFHLIDEDSGATIEDYQHLKRLEDEESYEEGNQEQLLGEGNTEIVQVNQTSAIKDQIVQEVDLGDSEKLVNVTDCSEDENEADNNISEFFQSNVDDGKLDFLHLPTDENIDDFIKNFEEENIARFNEKYNDELENISSIQNMSPVSVSHVKGQDEVNMTQIIQPQIEQQNPFKVSQLKQRQIFDEKIDDIDYFENDNEEDDKMAEFFQSNVEDVKLDFPHHIDDLIKNFGEENIARFNEKDNDDLENISTIQNMSPVSVTQVKGQDEVSNTQINQPQITQQNPLQMPQLKQSQMFEEKIDDLGYFENDNENGSSVSEIFHLPADENIDDFIKKIDEGGIAPFNENDNDELENISRTQNMYKVKEQIEVTKTQINEPQMIQQDQSTMPQLKQHQILEKQKDVQIQEEENDYQIQKLQELLPGLPLSRIQRLKQIYRENLADPSLLELIPILRENMPQNVTISWLRETNLRNAEIALNSAENDDLVDSSVLNAMLQVISYSSVGLDKLLEFHEERFQQFTLTPTSYDDRIVLQAFLKSGKFSWALGFKEKIEKQNRTLDLLSYGSLIEYCGNRRQIGSALLLLKECIHVHGFPPHEKNVMRLRRTVHIKGLLQQTKLLDIIGEDPTYWRYHGQKTLKRERSYKGRRGVIETKNAITRRI